MYLLKIPFLLSGCICDLIASKFLVARCPRRGQNNQRNKNIYIPSSGAHRHQNISSDPPCDEAITRGPRVASGSQIENILDGRNVESAHENKQFVMNKRESPASNGATCLQRNNK